MPSAGELYARYDQVIRQLLADMRSYSYLPEEEGGAENAWYDTLFFMVANFADPVARRLINYGANSLEEALRIDYDLFVSLAQQGYDPFGTGGGTNIDTSPIPSPYVGNEAAPETLTYNSYSGADIVAVINLPGERPMTLGELQTISYSVHRENTPIRTIGHVNPIGFVKGPRTIAGTCIFTVFDQYVFYKLRRYQAALSTGLYPLSDMLPPFDIVLSFVNELGRSSKLRIFGVSIIDEGGTMSIDDLITEQTLTYMARGIAPMTRYDWTQGVGRAVDSAVTGAALNEFVPNIY